MKQAEYIQKLEDALQNLLDEQNGTPLMTREVQYNLAYWNARETLDSAVYVEPIKNKVIRLDFVGPTHGGEFTMVDQWIMEDGDTEFRYERRLHLKAGSSEVCDSMMIHWGDETILAAVEVAMAKEFEDRVVIDEEVEIELLIDELLDQQGQFSFGEDSPAADMLSGIFPLDDKGWE